MKTRLECVECFVKQARTTAQRCTSDPELRVRIVKEAMRRILSSALDLSPAEHSMPSYEAAMELSGVADPYAEEKRRHNELALGMYAELERMVRASSDPLRTAAKLAVAGNVIDLGIGISFDIRDEIARVLAGEFAIDHFDRFREEARGASSLAYLCDNAGEIVFDKLFLGELARAFPSLALATVVKTGPIINDATRADAEAVGLADVARVVGSGAAAIGVPYGRASAEVRGLLESSDLLLGKGQGNFETASEFPRPSYFVLKAKCACVADELGVSAGDVVFLRREGQGAWR